MSKDDEPVDKPADDSESPAEQSDDKPADESEQPEASAEKSDESEQSTDDQPSEQSEASTEKSDDQSSDETPSDEQSSDKGDQPADKSDVGQTSDEQTEETPAQKSSEQSNEQQPEKTDSGSSSPAKAAPADADFRKRCAELLAKHEGRMKHVYLDTLQIPSIGIGFNLKRGGAREALQKVGADYDKVLAGTQDLSEAQIDGLFNKDLDTALAAAHRQVANFDDLAFNARLVVVDMMFMGEAAFAGFKKLIAALKNRDYNTAADEMKNSQWYVQVKNRGIEDVALMRATANQ